MDDTAERSFPVTPELISHEVMAPVLVGKEKPKPIMYRAPPELAERLERAAKSLRISRNDAMTQLLTFALDEHERDRRPKAKR